MARSSRLRLEATATLGLAALAIIVACSSSSDDASSPSNTAGSSGAPNGASGHGGTPAGGGSGAAHAGNAGKSGGAGMNGGAGSPAAGTGGVSGEAGSANGSAGESDGAAGAAGEAGSANGFGHELAYVVGLTAGTSEFELGRNGALQPLADGVVKSTRGDPYAIVVSPDQRFLYEVEDDAKLRSYALDERGAISKTPFSVLDTGDTPEALAVTNDGKFLYVGDGAGIEVYAVDPSSGIPTSTGSALALAASVQALALSPNGKVLYSTQPAFGVHAFQVNPETGALTELSGSPFVKTVFPRGGIALTPNGKFMYASGMGLNAISVADDGTLTSIATYLDDVLSDGYAPNVAITKDGHFVYATQFLTKQPTGNGFGLFSGFAIHDDGTLAILDGFPMPVNNAYSAAIDPSSHFLFLGMDDLGLFSVFSIADNGSVKPVDGSPFTALGFEPLFAFATRP